ncbi:hypothetical protein BCV69DRAFT_107966 [Microstroma glucosiphilum]|uniref:Cyclin N-terminal domain-containing protein n=1 Tax=Pseudomicrostroma glucosiphilum TaxID=1684307 RepID=A0A316UFA9_9BASI|nr:hypothetical protein BCV69DRAFT_107966 [Pseudomicrostroma glucosiphilum]PWN23101.1 hypothetical protein BCV69DRAFT_107966 [Pseudomicrostroma glucosiphilum]
MAYTTVPPAVDAMSYGNLAQQAPLPMHTSTYQSADGTQAFAVDEYGRHWQLPPAPKLTSAAARRWNDAVQDRFSSMLPYTAPWAAMTNPSYQQAHQQPAGPQHHYDIEQQMMLHHQISKQQQRRSIPQLPPPRSHFGQHTPGFLPQYQTQPGSAFAAGRPSANNGGWQNFEQSSDSFLPTSYSQQANWTQSNALPEHPYQRSSYGAPETCPANPPSYDLRQTQSQQGAAEVEQFRLAERNAWQDPSYRHDYNTWQSGNGQPAPFQERRRSEFADRAGARAQTYDWTLPAPQQSQKYWQGRDEGGQQESLSRGGWQHQSMSYGQSRHHSRSQSQVPAHWPSQIDQQHQQQSLQQQERQQRAPSSGNHHAQPHLSQGHIASSQQQQQYDAGAPAAAAHEVIQEPADSAPAPPSPNTLDRSGVSISNFGAELVWNACIGLLDPELILEARREDLGDSNSPTSTSSLSSPMLSTPLTTPQSPSSGGKDLDASAKLLSTLGLNYGLPPHHEQDEAGEAEWSAWEDGSHNSGSRPSESSSGPGSAVRQPSTSSSEQPSSQPLQPTPSALSSPMQLSSSSSPRDKGAASASIARTRSGSRQAVGRTRSQERSRASVLSVLGLVSPQWQWTHASASLPTLFDQSQRSFEMDRHRDGEDASAHMPSAVQGSESSPAFRRFAHQVLAQTLLSPTAFLLGLLYALRIPLIAVDTQGRIDPEAVEVLASPPSAAPFKIFTLGLMIANKHLDDNTFLNKTWNEVTGIPLTELNKMEQYYLIRSNYEIALPDRIWVSFLKRVQRREESKGWAASPNDRTNQQHRPVGNGRGSLTSAHGASPSARDETSQKVLSALSDMLSALWSALPHQQHQGISSGEGRSQSHQPQRPTAALVDHHHQCRSAPAGAMQYGVSDDLPSRLPASQSQRPGYDALARSLSDFAAASASSASPATTTTSSRPPSRTHPRMHEAPLAPSALLELLNSGRNLTSAH